MLTDDRDIGRKREEHFVTDKNLIRTRKTLLSCPAAMIAPRNQWYIAALSQEVTRGMLARQILDDHIVFFRTEDGSPVGLADRCPHRGVPLSMGSIQNDAIRCAYHGIEFGRTGACHRIPSQSKILPQLSVQSYPLLEIGPYIWIWMGDQAQADESLLPDQFELGITRPGWRVTPLFVMEMACNYQILHENLLDTSHISFLHPGLLDTGSMATSSFKANYEGGKVRISRDLIETPNEMMAKTFNLTAGKAYRRTLITEAIPPQLSLIVNIFTDPENPDAPPHILTSPQGVTPSGNNRCLNFLINCSSYPEPQPEDALPHLWKLFEQDKVVLEAVQRRFDEEGWDLPEVSVMADTAALKFRLKMVEMVEAERKRAATAKPLTT
jgi:phenylpropionate dioxygenase-like ring-hydroxylating dioxygenase large terminal subunit